ncbi:unnamed protein product [Rhodiola kirilowii]
MPPFKKSKKICKDSKKRKISNAVPVDPTAVDTEWWDSFWEKNSSAVGLRSSDDEEGFRHFFRVSKSTFDYICSLVRENLISRPPSGLINIEGRLLSVEKQAAIALRRLASGESQVSVGASFGVGQSTVSQVTWRFIEAMEEHAKHHLKWPDSARLEEIKMKFEAMYGLPNCCGAIDATHVIMTLPAVETSGDWCDQEKNYSMFVQGIVDHELRFLDFVAGWPGGMTLSRLVKFSSFYKLSEAGERLNGRPKTITDGAKIREYIVGGPAYPLLPWLITPDKSDDVPDLMADLDRFLNPASSLASKAFSQLKGNWRILSKVMWRPDKRKLPSIILVCCLLHNIVIDSRDRLNPDISLPGHHDSPYEEQHCKQADPLGTAMRDNLAKYLESTKHQRFE